MGFSEILTLISGLIQFPGTILQFIKLMQKSPQEKHEAIMERIRLEAQAFEDTGRPKWD
jgi:hypothetical protein